MWHGGTVAKPNLFLYSFTLPTDHSLGTNNIVNGGFRTAGSTEAYPNAFLTFNVASATQYCVGQKLDKYFNGLKILCLHISVKRLILLLLNKKISHC